MYNLVGNVLAKMNPGIFPWASFKKGAFAPGFSNVCASRSSYSESGAI